MPVVLPTAQTTHDDLKGTASVDLNDGEQSLLQLARLAGVDTDQFQPIGLSLVWEHGQLYPCFFCIDLPRMKGFALDHKGKMPILRCQVELPLDVLLGEIREAELILFDPKKALENFLWPEEGPLQS